jgi:hypothetical protein
VGNLWVGMELHGRSLLVGPYHNHVGVRMGQVEGNHGDRHKDDDLVAGNRQWEDREPEAGNGHSDHDLHNSHGEAGFSHGNPHLYEGCSLHEEDHDDRMGRHNVLLEIDCVGGRYAELLPVSRGMSV